MDVCWTKFRSLLLALSMQTSPGAIRASQRSLFFLFFFFLLLLFSFHLGEDFLLLGLPNGPRFLGRS